MSMALVADSQVYDTSLIGKSVRRHHINKSNSHVYHVCGEGASFRLPARLLSNKIALVVLHHRYLQLLPYTHAVLHLKMQQELCQL